MKTDLFMTYDDAQAAAAGGGSVKATTLDQVTYPLVLKRGRMRMSPPPFEVQHVEIASRSTVCFLVSCKDTSGTK